MVSGIATLDQLRSISDDYASLNKRGEDFRERLNQMLVNKNVNALATGYDSMSFINSLKRNFRDSTLTEGNAREALDKCSQNVLQSLLTGPGVLCPHGLRAVPFDHTEQDLEKTFEAVSSAATELETT
jgi:glutamate-1-semialdehyde aminotransferase